MKKKMIAMLLAAACIGTGTLNCAAVNAAEQDTAFIMGDVNGDGAFGVSDAVLLQKWLSAVPDTHLADWRAADFCADNQLNVCDLTLMKRALLEDIQDPVEPPADHIAPLGFQTADDAIKEIIQSDLSIIKGYGQMFERFRNDGFIYQVTENEWIRTNEDRGTTLFPYARYEDIGVGCYVTFQGNNYHIMFYSADADVLAETDGIAAYLKKRMGRSSDKEIAVNDQNVSLLFHENGQCYANAFVDENHYFDVIGAVSEEEMTDFLNAFAYEKTVF